MAFNFEEFKKGKQSDTTSTSMNTSNTPSGFDFQKFTSQGTIPTTVKEPQESDFIKQLNADIDRRYAELQSIGDRFTNQSIQSTALQTAGTGAGFATDVGTNILGQIPGVKQATEAIGKGIASIPGVDNLISMTASGWEAFKKDNPTAAANIEASINIGSLYGGMKATEAGISFAKKEALKLLEKKAVGTIAKETTGLLEMTAPELNKAEKISTLKKAGEAGGITEKKGLLGPTYTRLPSKYDLEVAKSVEGVMSPKNGLTQNLYNTSKEIEKTAQETGKFLERNPRIFNNKTLNKRLTDMELPLSVKGDAALENTYTGIRDAMMKIIDKNPHTMKGLWDSRQEFDRLMTQEYGNAIFDISQPRNQAIKRAIKDMRSNVNQFIIDQTKDVSGSSVFQTNMKKMSNMIEAADRYATNNYKLLDTTGFKRWVADNPMKVRTLRWIGYGAAGSVGLGGVSTLFGQ